MDEQRALLSAYDKGRRKTVKPIIELLLITGARIGEVLALRWEDCAGGYLRFVKTRRTAGNAACRPRRASRRLAQCRANIPSTCSRAAAAGADIRAS